MKYFTRHFGTLALMTWMSSVAVAAQAPKPSRPAMPGRPGAIVSPASTQSPATFQDGNAHAVQNALNQILRQYPPSLIEMLRLDPSLASNGDYMAMYPTLNQFISQHPEITHNPAFFFGNGPTPSDPAAADIRAWRDVVNTVVVPIFFLCLAFVAAWVAKSINDHRRWRRASDVQAEAHTKLLDRFSSNEDLLTYIQTPVGRHFLESTPINLDGAASFGAPINRILWSVQVGLVLAAGGFGLSYAIPADLARSVSLPLTVISVLGIALGIGFVLSAAVSYKISQQLGLLDRTKPRPPAEVKQAPTQL